ncbi:uncharacterized protein LOC123527523 isoform X2 [Mercenaria mercenaria]|nr:uncharacterized protein LOC123527523 isoform X2 [Mercenaria mercenaria]XP_045162969.2 uncharacterized protein LOC123527523 isoform X2 [Mercenaria mercenaria]
MKIINHIALVAGLCVCVDGHGRLTQPPSRSTMWRFGYNTPHNYNDNQLFCGGFSVQWNQNGGKCGVCGDNIKDKIRENEAPDGKYATGTIVAKYEVGQMMEIKVHITANHKGWFEYRLCRNDNSRAAVTQDCFDQNLLADESGATRFTITSSMFHISHWVKLPDGLSCSACVLQWKYNTGNSWGKDEKGKGCIGCGPQEQFYGCADIAIGADDIEIPAPNGDVVVPDGDVDEREEIDKTDEYNSNGECMCKCALTSGAMNISIISGTLCWIIVQALYIAL